MDLVTIPVVNGLLPRALDGEVEGVFLDPFTAEMLAGSGTHGTVFLSPYSSDDARLFEVGVIGRVIGMWVDEVYIGEPPVKQAALFLSVRGVGRGRADGFSWRRQVLTAQGVRAIDLDRIRARGYPVICGSGWRVSGGTTDQTPGGPLTVTVGGIDLTDGSEVAIRGRLEGLVSAYQAHTIEHGIVRSLGQYGVCTARTLARSIAHEARELRSSIDQGFAEEIPEVFGITSSGACGNPLTHLARFLLVRDLIRRLKRGDSVALSLDAARKRALSELSSALQVDTGTGLRVVQGLHRGMRHDDTRLTRKRLESVLERFPGDPWH